MPASTVVRCPAKINLGLCILGRQPDGYHELRTVFQTISLHDRLRLEVWPARRAEVEVACNFPELANETNLAVRAVRAVLGALKLRRKVRVELTKVIPPGSGLGGGSSNAAGVLRALPRLAGRPLPLERGLALAAQLGADVPFFLIGGQALGLGRGQELYPLPEAPARAVLVVHPGFQVSTAEAYRRLDEARSRVPAVAEAKARREDRGSPGTLTTPAPDHMIFSLGAALLLRRWDRLQNDFEPVVFSAYPELARLKRFLIRAGASPALLSGSGSAMFAVFDSGVGARAAAARLRKQRPEWRVWVTRTMSRREYQAAGPAA